MPLYPHKLLHIHPTASRKKCQGRDFAHKRSKKVSSSDDRWCAQLSEGMYGFFLPMLYCAFSHGPSVFWSRVTKTLSRCL